jgi:hypothetical protein
MKKYSILLVMAVIAVIFAGCAQVNVTSFKDPNYQNKKFINICVYADVDDLYVRKYLEDQVVDQFEMHGISAIQGYLFFPPTQKWEDGAIEKVLLEKKFDGYLLIAQKDRNVSPIVNPGSVQTDVVHSSYTDKKTGKEVKEKSTVTSVSPTTVSYNMFSDFRISLIDPTNRQTAWIADGTGFISSGNIFSGDKAIMRRLALKLFQELEKNKLVDEK